MFKLILRGSKFKNSALPNAIMWAPFMGIIVQFEVTEIQKVNHWGSCNFTEHNKIPRWLSAKSGLVSVCLEVVLSVSYLLGQREQYKNATWVHLLPWWGWIVFSCLGEAAKPNWFLNYSERQKSIWIKCVIEFCVAWTTPDISSKEYEFQWSSAEKSPST